MAIKLVTARQGGTGTERSGVGNGGGLGARGQQPSQHRSGPTGGQDPQTDARRRVTNRKNKHKYI